MTSPGPAIEVRDLRRSYGALQAVRGVSFEVARGEVFCLLGPNGAGKTTIVEILEGYRTRSGGDARVLGIDPATGARELREQVGIVLQQCGVQSDLTVAELVEMYGRYHVRSRGVDEVLALVELTEKRDVRAKALSGGQRRRLDLALALVGEPELIFLDEPTTGFDPAARRQAWETIRSLCSLGKTVFLTTHFMDEAQYLADRVAVMRDGEIIALGRPDELGGRDVRPAEIRFSLPRVVAPGDLPDAARRAALAGGRPDRPAHARAGASRARADRLGAGARGQARALLGHAAVAGGHLSRAHRTGHRGRRRGGQCEPSGGHRMSTVTSRIPRSSLRRDLGLVGWQIRYEQRSYWRNRGRGIFTFAFPIMFLVIFASLDKGQHISSRGGIPYDDFFVPGILAYGVIATTFINLSISTAILRDEGVLKRMQGTPLPRWAYAAARIGSTFLIMAAMAVVVIGLGAAALGPELPARGAARADRDPAAGDGRVHRDRDRDHPLHPQRRGRTGGRQPGRAAADLHLQHLVPDRLDAEGPQGHRRRVPDQGAGRRAAVRVRSPPGGSGLNGADLRVLAIWTVVGVVPDAALPAQPQGEVV